MPKRKVGTFAIHGNKRDGYWLVDECTFNSWGTQLNPNGVYFKTLDEAATYAVRCVDFKEGRRMSV